jgi:MFS transporter, NNP family, nitrate/nitrite transporter
MVAAPVLAGAVLRIVSGVFADHLKPRLTGVIMQLIVIGGLAAFWAFGVTSFEATLALGIVLGVAGASFAVALPLASYWYPPEYQGTALGIAGAGNSGTVLAALFAPSLAVLFGWRNVLGLAIVPLAIVLALFILLAKDSPRSPPRKSLKDYADVLRASDAWWLMAFYCVSFGGFVGLSSFRRSISTTNMRSRRSRPAIARRPRCSPAPSSGRSAARSPIESAASRR